jgi:hypothetical protein
MDEMETFEALKKPTTVEELEALGQRMAMHVDAVEEESFEHEFLELDLARAIVASYRALLADAASLDADQRATLRAGIEYFVVTDDDENDVTSPIGVEDDARVAKKVFEQLGRPDLAIPLP